MKKIFSQDTTNEQLLRIVEQYTLPPASIAQMIEASFNKTDQNQCHAASKPQQSVVKISHGISQMPDHELLFLKCPAKNRVAIKKFVLR